MKVHSFSPIVSPDSRLLILGSMPGKASLAAGQYYAHPRNGFWPMMGELFGFDFTDSYAHRCAALSSAGVAVWDTLKTCTRSSSLDSDIVESSIVPNDIPALLDRYPGITRIYFNGAKAEQIYRRYILPDLPQSHSAIPLVRLPSTSPANASISIDKKRQAWLALLD